MVIITDWQCWWQVSLQVVGNERKVIIGDDRQAVVAQAGRLGRPAVNRFTVGPGRPVILSGTGTGLGLTLSPPLSSQHWKCKYYSLNTASWTGSSCSEQKYLELNWM